MDLLAKESELGVWDKAVKVYRVLERIELHREKEFQRADGSL